MWEACKVESINALGRQLMELRQKSVLSNNRLDCVESMNTPPFLLFNRPIEVICVTQTLENLL